ncbi:MAG: hypothetical protein JNJ76_01265 [Candidatus Competibacter sp.]|nr:hypothetical protein [Candidatus Competibacter sp.]
MQPLTIRQLSERFPAFSEPAIRNLVFCAKERHSSQGPIPGNGLDRAIIRVGRKVLIDAEQFQAWLREKQSGGHAKAAA